ncbi:MAG TPA: ABC transporter ATP-binding protein [Terriglobia bacterium]|nr:ABC transporter ATP-binding protein [Terriglobia bacterium]
MLQNLRPLKPYLARYKGQYIAGFTALVVNQIVGITVPLFIMWGIDGMRRGAKGSELLFLAGLILAAALIKAIFQFWMRWILIGASRDIEYDLRNDLFAHLMRLSQRYYHETRTGELMAKLTNDLTAVRNLLGPGIMYSATTLVVGISCLALMLHLDWQLTLVAVIPMPLVSLAVKHFGQQIHDRFEKIQAMYSDLTERVRESLSGVRVVRAFCQEEAEMSLFERMNQEFVEKNKGLIWMTSFLWPSLATLFGVSFLLILLVGGWHVLSHRITLGTFMAFNVYMTYLIWPMIALGYVTNVIQRGLASQERLWMIFRAEPEIDDRNVPESPIRELRGEIEFRDLTFSYNGRPVLKNVNLHIPAGKSVAIVGATGSGKTTLVSLVPRLFDAPPGTLLIDGVPAREIPLRTLRKDIGFVPQETFLFSETIRENVKFGLPAASDAEVERAAEVSNILPEIRGFPKGFETMVGERGLTLSGGQKQRAAISRAVIRNPRILILDDALSSVDTHTEERILSQLTQIMAGRTTLMISHRISTIQNADEIVVLQDGEIVQRGTHSELLAVEGPYAELYNRQLIEEELEKEE